VLQVSGGRDSLATLFVMAPQWEDMTVAWCDGGDSAPELYAFMAKIKQTVPRFVRVEGIAPSTRARPTATTWVSCCAAGIWKPMWEWLKENAVTTVIRGTRKSDPFPFPTPGSEHDGIRFQMPIWDWSDERLARALDIIAQRGFKPVYPHDCLHCPVERICDRPELRNVNS
jgi:Phosphoadenosine phosphosulfate reductase family